MRPAIPFTPADRNARCDRVLTRQDIETIREAVHRRYGESPFKKDRVRRRLGRGRWEHAQAMIRRETLRELWVWFCSEYPALASKLASEERPQEVPKSFRRALPWNLRRSGGESCLCQSCAGMDRKTSAASRGAVLIQGAIDLHESQGEAGAQDLPEEAWAYMKSIVNMGFYEANRRHGLHLRPLGLRPAWPWKSKELFLE